MNMNCEDVRADLGAYALGALDAANRAAIAQHLEVCPGCLEELKPYQRIAQGLLFAAPNRATAPTLAAIKTQLMAQVGSTLAPPLTAAPLRNRAMPVRQNLLQRFWDWLFGHFHVPRWAVGALASIGLVATGLLGVQTVRYVRLFSQYQQAVSLLADAEARAVRLEGQKSTPKAWATLRYRTDSTVGLMNVGDLPAQPQKSYQLWLVDAQGKRDSGAVFMTQVNGKASYVVIAPRQFNSYVRFGVSIEPAGGSPGPTGPAALLSEVMR